MAIFTQTLAFIKALKILVLNIAIFVGTFSFGQTVDKTKDSLIQMLNGQNCEITYSTSVGKQWDDNGNISGAQLIVFAHVDPKIQHFAMDTLNYSFVLEACVQMMKTESYDWVACLLLYDLTQRDPKELSGINDCEKWRKKSKEAEIAYWNEYLYKPDPK